MILLPFRTVYPYIKYYNGKQNEQINEKIQEINDLSIDLYSLFVDTYLLRRILDKKYINNCVVYTGAHHSVNYIYFLIKYCDFKLINIHNSVEKDINKITDLIKNTENVYDIYSLIYLKKKIYLQCIKYEDIKSNYHRYMGSRIVY